jgi:hypothetical protein
MFEKLRDFKDVGWMKLPPMVAFVISSLEPLVLLKEN